jgi:hypothetical protein
MKPELLENIVNGYHAQHDWIQHIEAVPELAEYSFDLGTKDALKIDINAYHQPSSGLPGYDLGQDACVMLHYHRYNAASRKQIRISLFINNLLIDALEKSADKFIDRLHSLKGELDAKVAPEIAPGLNGDQ